MHILVGHMIITWTKILQAELVNIDLKIVIKTACLTPKILNCPKTFYFL